MENMHLVQTPPTIDLLSVSDFDVEAFFASAGIAVEVVTHCNTAGCSQCFSDVAAEAA